MEMLKEQLKRMKTQGRWNPDARFVSQGKESLLLANRSRTRSDEPAVALPGIFTRLRIASHLLFPVSIQSAFRPVMSVIFVGFFAISGWIATVSAAYNSVPGDVLYSVKLAAEKTQEAVVSVTGSRSAQAKLHVEFATRRAQEVKQVLAKKDSNDKQQAVTSAINSLEKSMAAAKDSVSDVSKNEPGETIAIAKNINDRSPEIVSALQEVSKDTTAIGDAALAKKVVETTKLVNDTGIAAVEAVVQKQATGDTSVPPNEVKDLVRKQIETIAEDNKTTTAALATTTMSVVSSSLPMLSSAASTTSPVAGALDMAKSAGETAKGAIQEAKNFVQNNQLFEALQEVKKANQATQEVKQAAVDAEHAVKDAIGTAPVLAPATTTQAVVGSTLATTTKK